MLRPEEEQTLQAITNGKSIDLRQLLPDASAEERFIAVIKQGPQIICERFSPKYSAEDIANRISEYDQGYFNDLRIYKVAANEIPPYGDWPLSDDCYQVICNPSLLKTVDANTATQSNLLGKNEQISR